MQKERQLGIPKSEQHKENIRKSKIGVHQTKEHQDNVQKGRNNKTSLDNFSKHWKETYYKRPLETCEYCGYESRNPGILVQYHNDNCKHNPNRNIENTKLKIA